MLWQKVRENYKIWHFQHEIKDAEEILKFKMEIYKNVFTHLASRHHYPGVLTHSVLYAPETRPHGHVKPYRSLSKGSIKKKKTLLLLRKQN